MYICEPRDLKAGLSLIKVERTNEKSDHAVSGG